MVVVELIGWWIVGVLWGILAVTVLGMVLPYPTIIFITVYWIWSNSPLGRQSRYWLFDKLHVS
jgi:hypothetical protein